MGKLKHTGLVLILLFHSLFAFAQIQKRLGVEVCYTDDTFNCQFQPPKPLATSLNINKITFTFKDVDIIVDSQELREDSWGMLFTSPAQGGGAAGEFQCSPRGCANGAINVLANNEGIQVVTDETNRVNRLVGTVVFTLSQFRDGKLPSALQSLINSAQDGNLIVTATYLANEGNYNPQNPPANQPAPTPGTQFRSTPYFWGADQGTLVNAPTLSVLARFKGLLIKIEPPTDLTSVQQNAFDPEDGPSQLIPALEGNISGYLLVLWKALNLDGTQPCSTSGLWHFVPNPISYNSHFKGAPPPPPTLSCVYSPYVESVDGIGGISNPFGCAFALPTSPVPPYLATNADVPILTSENVAVPANFTSSEIKISFLKEIINNPSVEYPVPGTCYSVVYVPSNQTSYGKMNVENGEVYGISAWTLNFAYSDDDPTPNLSLNHSNLSFMTGGEFDLASLDKDPSLTLKTSDCFVATAASGDVNSKSVFYWRVLRDEYLTKIGFTKFYYRHAKKWAHWLDEHPKFKPPVHFVLENTGAALYYTSLYTKKSLIWLKAHTQPLRKAICEMWAQEAAADEFEENRKISFDLGIGGGVFFPSSDRSLFKKYYPKPTVDFSAASNMIFWTWDLGWSVGLKGDFAFNSSSTYDKTLGTATQKNTRFLSFSSFEAIAGLRYRTLNFLYLQPGVFAGAGILRMREEGKPAGDRGDNGAQTQNQTLGVTYWSPVFDFGANLDISLATLFFYSRRELAYERDILLRLSAIYRINPSKAVEMSGFILNAGFAFLF